jgi:DNA invertase Pin-like site-specific DNA recombinase
MSKITTEHLARSAYVYIRQSTADQLTHNHESRRRQYGLANRARQLGWTAVEVIDDDLGRSGGGTVRPGFERLLAAICEARVGAVLAIEASRLARNGRDWHTLIEFCGLVGTLIVDEDGIYDPRHPNDRLLLGMKGTMSELELSLFRQRSQEALKQKANRGALILGVAAGYVKVGRDRIEKNPDERVRDALQLVFSKFAEFQSARQVHIWLRDEGIELPVKSRDGEARGIVWRLPAYNIVHNILTNPIYAGAYAFGRTTSKVSVEQGRKRVRRGVHRPMAEWDVLIKDHHELHHLGGVREEPARDRQQCNRQRQRHGQGSGTVRRAVAARTSALWSLRPQAACVLQWQARPLQLLWRPHEPRHGTLHLDQWLEHRQCGRCRGAAHPEAARH